MRVTNIFDQNTVLTNNQRDASGALGRGKVEF